MNRKEKIQFLAILSFGTFNTIYWKSEGETTYSDIFFWTTVIFLIIGVLVELSIVLWNRSGEGD